MNQCRTVQLTRVLVYFWLHRLCDNGLFVCADGNVHSLTRHLADSGLFTLSIRAQRLVAVSVVPNILPSVSPIVHTRMLPSVSPNVSPNKHDPAGRSFGAGEVPLYTGPFEEPLCLHVIQGPLSESRAALVSACARSDVTDDLARDGCSIGGGSDVAHEVDLKDDLARVAERRADIGLAAGSQQRVRDKAAVSSRAAELESVMSRFVQIGQEAAASVPEQACSTDIPAVKQTMQEVAEVEKRAAVAEKRAEEAEKQALVADRRVDRLQRKLDQVAAGDQAGAMDELLEEPQEEQPQAPDAFSKLRKMNYRAAFGICRHS